MIKSRLTVFTHASGCGQLYHRDNNSMSYYTPLHSLPYMYSIHVGRTTEFEALVNRYEAVIHPGFITIITCINPPGVTCVELVPEPWIMHLRYSECGHSITWAPF